LEKLGNPYKPSKKYAKPSAPFNLGNFSKVSDTTSSGFIEGYTKKWFKNKEQCFIWRQCFCFSKTNSFVSSALLSIKPNKNSAKMKAMPPLFSNSRRIKTCFPNTPVTSFFSTQKKHRQFKNLQSLRVLLCRVFYC